MSKPEPTFFGGKYVLVPLPPSDCDNRDKPFIHSPGLDFLPAPKKLLSCPWLRFSGSYALEPDETVLRTNAVMLPIPGSLNFLEAYHLNLGQGDYLEYAKVADAVRPLVREAVAPLLAEVEVLAAYWLGDLRAEQGEYHNPSLEIPYQDELAAPLTSLLQLTIDLSGGRYRKAQDDVCSLSLSHGTGSGVSGFKFLRSYGVTPDGRFATDEPFPGSLSTTKPWTDIMARWEKGCREELADFMARAYNAVMELEAAARAATAPTP